jgi:hypothetical protein
MCLVNFRTLNRKCKWPGCKNKAVKPLNCPEYDWLTGKLSHCLRHHLIKRSGRVGPNWKRDHYREHLTPYDKLSERSWGQQHLETKKIVKNLNKYYNANLNLTRYQLIRVTTRSFDVDHIDGNHSNNKISNLQTLIKTSHKIKTDLMGDAIPMFARRNK